MSSNKDLLKLENEFRDELPKYTEKPKITPMAKPSKLTGRLSSFLASAAEKSAAEQSDYTKDETTRDKGDNNKVVEMDIYITPTTEE